MNYSGRTSPWNTFAIWSVRQLGLTGFPMIGDGAGRSSIAGIEVNIFEKFMKHNY
jgi:hypothetical protein